ncbi:MAG: sugar ABC transporter permease [Anaerolineae bacterium]|nr:sugar ABC transporter permease [Chloroflexota bacterium]MBN8635173.1 sugar ABC transporter permease [Anaerolineae bacterium]
MEQGLSLDTGARSSAEATGARRAVVGKPLFERAQPYLYLLPALVLLFIWVYRPLIEIVMLSFNQWNLLPTSPKTPVGWANYQQVLSLPEIRQALINTVAYTVGLLPFSLVGPIVIAIFTYGMRGRASGLYRAIIFTPVIIAPVVVTVLWRWILHPYTGIVNYILKDLFHADPINFMGDPALMIPSITFITGWGLIGFCTLIFAAALTNINREYLEAAAIDGAGYWQMIRFVMLPLLSPSILFVALLTVLFSSQWTFVHINVASINTFRSLTSNIYTVLYDYGFRSFNIGVSSAAAVLMFVGFSVIAVIFLWLQNRYSFYDH